MILIDDHVVDYKAYENQDVQLVSCTPVHRENNFMMIERPEENNRDVDELEMEEICVGCGTEESEWKGNQGKGYMKNKQVFCCKDCAEEIECICGL
jgi:hypothetical protein